MNSSCENGNCLKNKTVLIVDDYAINLDLMKIFVQQADALSLCASNGAQCLETLKNKKVDMILMDLNMPQMNGLETTRAIRAMPQFENVVIIGVIGYEDQEEIDSCKQAGMNDAVPKFSFSQEKLIELANIYFGENSHVSDTSNSSIISNHKTDVLPVIDFQKALRDFEDDSELLLSLTEEFALTLKKQLDIIANALQKNDLKRIEMEAHSIRGGAANIHAYRLAEAARELEKSCRTSQSLNTIQNNQSALQKQIDDFSSFVQCYVRQTVVQK